MGEWVRKLTKINTLWTTSQTESLPLTVVCFTEIYKLYSLTVVQGVMLQIQTCPRRIALRKCDIFYGVVLFERGYFFSFISLVSVIKIVFDSFTNQ